MLVGAGMTLLADCGRSASPCCRHVDISTVVHRRRRPSTICPRLPPGLSPGRTQARGSVFPSVGAGAYVRRRSAGQRAVVPPALRRRTVPRPVRTAGRSPLVTWHTRDLPNLCTFLGTTRRSVDDGHRAHTDGYPVVSGLLGCRFTHTAVDRPWDGRARSGAGRRASGCRRGPGRRRNCGEDAPRTVVPPATSLQWRPVPGSGGRRLPEQGQGSGAQTQQGNGSWPRTGR